MSLPKHLRPRYRYLAVAVEAWPDAEIDRGAFQRRIWAATRALVGDAESAAVDPTLLRFAFADGAGEAVVRVRRGESSTARAALACVDGIDGQPVGVCVRGISGTVRGCEEKYLGERTESEAGNTAVFEGASRAAVVRGGRADVRTDDAFTGATHLDFEHP